MHPGYDILASFIVLAVLFKATYDAVTHKQGVPETAALRLWWLGVLLTMTMLVSIYQMFWFGPLSLWLSHRLANLPLMDAHIFAKASAPTRLALVAGAICVPTLFLAAHFTERA